MFAGAPFATSSFAALSGNVFVALINESAAGADVTSALAGFGAAVQETASGSDQYGTRATQNPVVLDGAAGSDQNLARFPWGVINTAQATDWQVITTAQLTPRVTVGGGFSAGSISSGPFSGLGGDTRIAPLPDTWQNINSDQASAWALIKTA